MPIITKELARELKKQEKQKKEEELAEAARQAEEKRKKEEEEARIKAEKDAQEKARLEAESKARKEAQWRDSVRRFLVNFRSSKCDPIAIADEETFQNRYGLIINRTVLASTYQAQIYPAKQGKPRLSTAAAKPVDPAEAQMVVRVTVLDKCFIDYRKHLLEHSLKLIKYLGTPDSASKSPALRHKSLVRIFEVFNSDKKVYIFMEQLPEATATLSARIKQAAGLTLAEVAATAKQIGDALLFLSLHGLAHLNVRSDNFLWNGDKQVKMVGLSRLFVFWDSDLEQKILHRSLYDNRNYMDHFPPEVTREGVDFDAAQVDVFSFGFLLVQMLTREKPFKKRQPFKGTENMRSLWEEQKEKMKHLSASVLAMLETMLAKKPEERPSMEEVLENAFFAGATAAPSEDASTPAENER